MAELNLTEAELKQYLLFRPQSLRRFSDVLGKQTPMVHYTSAEAGISILANRKIWLRNAAFMNDASEIKYAMDMLGAYSTTATQTGKLFGRRSTDILMDE